MTRRELLARLAASAPAAFLASVVSRPRTYGRVTVALAQAKGWMPARVTIDGLDVSKNCMECDDVAGYVDVWATNARGHKYLDPGTGHLAVRRIHGPVVFTPNGARPDA